MGAKWVHTLAMCALAGIDPTHVINAGPAERSLLIEVANRVHKLVEDANKRARRS